MTMEQDWIYFPSPDGQINAFVVKPDGAAPRPALILLHPVMGITPDIKETAARYAARGFFVVVPDVYTNDPGFRKHTTADIDAAAHVSRDEAERDAQLAAMAPDAREAIVAARAWMDARPAKGYIRIVKASFEAVRARDDVRSVGCVGYCMGGRLAGELAAEGVDLAAAVIYYGGHPAIEKIPLIKCPIEGHYGVTDIGITDKVFGFAGAMHEAGKPFAYSVYNANHGFANVPGSLAYNAFAAEVAEARVQAFLARHLT